MITIWKQSNNSIVRTAMLEKHCWINVVTPDALEIETVKREYGIPEDIIRDILDVDERSRSEKDDTYHAVIFRVPVFTGNGEVQYYTVPLGVIITADVFITISGMETEVTADFFENRVRGIRLDKPLDLLVRLFLQSARQYLRFLKAINRHTDALEGELQRAVKNTELIKLLRMEKSLVFFTTSLRANELLFVKLEKTLFKNLDDQGAELLEDAITEARQAVEMANIHSNILSGMMDAFASVISNNLNVVMKRLTMISIVLMIPTFFASVYGMNVPLPFQTHNLAFAGILIVSAIFSIMSALLFTTKRMFREKKS